jgi:hypothetical protein
MANNICNENKIEKALRNSETFQKVLARAQKGDFDMDFEEAPSSGVAGYSATLKVTEIFTIRKGFSLETGEDYFQLYKEVFYVENPGREYFETVNPTVYRRVAKQSEHGDKKWADRVAKHFNIEVVDFCQEEKTATEE